MRRSSSQRSGKRFRLSSLTEEFESLQERVHAVYSDAPKTTDAAVKMAEVALKVNGDNTFTEKEIDMMLPATLKRRGNDE